MTARFRHQDSGTSEATWLTAPQWDSVALADPQALAAARTRVVVLSAHPDDETIGVGGLVWMLAHQGIEVRFITATAGESSHPQASAWTAAHLGPVRTAELVQAARVLTGEGSVVNLELPDGSLAGQGDALANMLATHLRPGDLVLAPWRDDGHSDHDALGAAAQTCAEQLGHELLFYPIWWWHWANPQSADWDRMVAVDLSIDALRAKSRALECFPSQTGPLGPQPGDGPVVGPALQQRAERLIEVLFTVHPGQRQAIASERFRPDSAPFDEMYDAGDDPWGFTDSFYETRKRALTQACLGRARYAQGVEIGCATGQLTAALAARVDAMTGVDMSQRALAVARSRHPKVTWQHGWAPDRLPDTMFDLIVLSEVGYFLTPSGWLATLRWARHHLALGGEIVLAHWQHPPRDIPLAGDLVHRQAAAMLDLPHRVSYRDADVWIDVWGEPISVAGVQVAGADVSGELGDLRNP